MYNLYGYVLALMAFINTISPIYAKVPDYIKQLAQLDDNTHLEHALTNILKPRVVGTAGHEEVATFIKKELESLGLTTEVDRFVATVPLSGNLNLTFSNILGTFNPEADQFLALACHYDSKYFADNPDFVGAIDSAVPCALILNVAKVLLPRLQDNSNRNDIGLMLIFFDGEEAFKEWTQEDSVYGSKHLAQKLSTRTTQLQKTNQVVNDIDRIEVLVLLDLIGASNSKFYNFFPRTESLHRDLVYTERELAKEGLLEGRNYLFMPRTKFSFIDDDHRPFIQKNVPVLHLIATPFPSQWHTEKDTAKNLHWPSIRNFNKVLRIFVYDYLNQHTDQVSFRE